MSGWMGERLRVLMGHLTGRPDAACCVICRRPVVEISLVEAGSMGEAFCHPCFHRRAGLSGLPHVVLWSPMWRLAPDVVRIRVETVLRDEGLCRCTPAADGPLPGGSDESSAGSGAEG